MLESIAAWILNSYIGEYFGNVNTDQLSIALHNGEVELEGLPLRRDAFKHWALPIEVSNGYIGKISLKIPVYHLKSEPWIISIDELFLIARPVTDFTYNEEVEKQILHEFKMSQLDSLESRWKAMHYSEKDSQSYYASSYLSLLNFGASFIGNIIENLQLKIKSVHIRYEDNSTLIGCPFASGIIIKNLSAQSTDENWVPKYVTREGSDYLRKLLELEGLCVYWDTNVQLFSHNSFEDMVKQMRTHLVQCSDASGKLIDHDYILAPVNGKAFIKRNCCQKPLKSCSDPRNIIDLQLEQFPVILTALQYKHILEWSVAYSRANIAWKYRKWRPNVCVRGNTRLWWGFAVDAHTETIKLKRTKRNWNFVLKRSRDIVKYFEVYHIHLTHPESFTREMRQIKDSIESELSFEELYCIRETVCSKCDKTVEKSCVENSSSSYWSLQNWFSGWFSYSDLNSCDSSAKVIEKSVNSISDINDIFMTKDAMFGRLNFSIKSASFALMAFSDNSFSPYSLKASENLANSLIEFEFSNVNIGVDINNLMICDNNCHNSKLNHYFNKFDMQIKIVFVCHSLNLLLLRTQSSIINENDAYKLVTASLNGCHITINFGSNEIGMDGLLEGLQVFDLITDPLNNKHKRVFSIGIDSSVDSKCHTNLSLDVKERFSDDKTISSNELNDKALSFSIRRLIGENILKVNIQMASLCYVHSTRLIYELTLCAANFKNYITIITDKIKSAATEVALGIVTKANTNSSTHLTINKNAKDLTAVSEAFIEDFRLNIYLQTPVIIFPISPSSYEVMVSHLGHISLKNHISSNIYTSLFNFRKHKNNIIFAEIRDLSLYSLDCSKNIKKGKKLENLTVDELYICKNYGISILQETILEISIEKANMMPNFQFESQDESGLNAFKLTNDLLPPKKICLSTKSHNFQKELVLTIDIPNINLRVSYNDLLMFWQILNSLSFQSQNVSQNISNGNNSTQPDFEIYALPLRVKQLENLGFTKEDCITALNNCSGDINDSAIWLSEHSTHKLVKNNEHQDIAENNNKNHCVRNSNSCWYNKFSVIEVRISNGTLCLIDDCNEADIPLLEFNTKNFRLIQHNSEPIREGFSQTSFSCDYYNSALSGWEPFIEDCTFQLSWNIIERLCHIKASEVPKKKISLHFDVKDIININVTSVFMDLIRTVSESWISDIKNYVNMSPSSKISFRHRTPFVPFVLNNETGCKVKFYLVENNEQSFQSIEIRKNSYQNNAMFNPPNVNWIVVEPNVLKPFSFEVKSNVRHSDSHKNKSHKIVLAVEGWKAVFPVSIDKIGVYFREANSEIICNETARIIFAISHEPNAKKLITIRSALLISNKTSNDMEMKFQNSSESLYISSNATTAVPLRLVRNKMQIRPCNVGVNISQTPIHWEHVRRSHECSSEMQVCTPISVTGNHNSTYSTYSTSSSYRLCVLVQRDNFPLDVTTQGLGLQSYRAQPAHTISLLPPIQLINLLPYDLKFMAMGSALYDTIKPGKEASVHYINTYESFTIHFSSENYPHGKPLVVNPGATRDFVSHIEMYDIHKRVLVLHANVSLVSAPCAMIVAVYAPYWFINRTGLPLIFKQEGASAEVAGQSQEHEIARSISPLLFSFSEPESGHSCTMRLGRSIGPHPRWCNSFYLEKGIWFRRLRVGQTDSHKPDKIYELGIDVRNGRDKYRDTQIVTISPRYQIENLTSYRLEIAQKFITFSEPEIMKENVISILTKSNVAFHWPQSDRDKLLCVRLASIANCYWSGGFAVEPSTSFHLNIRDESSKSHFIRVEILLQGTTYFIVFTDANNLPPPIRIENLSHVTIEFYQTKTIHGWMKSFVRPFTSVPYAWDESTLNPHITVRAPGGSCSTYDLHSLAPGDQLTYENFVYIAFTDTFKNESDDEKVSVGPHLINNDYGYQLVFDVQEGSRKVFLARKERGKRSQLWRIDNFKRLVHEGSSPPTDPSDSRRSNFYRTDKNSLVLDVSTICAIPGDYMPLMIRKIDAKRALTQTWNFTPDGRLCCEHPNLFVQVKNGLKSGKEVVLGPTQLNKNTKLINGVPVEQVIAVQKLRKGSGVLSVSVLADGPTRVLRISDVKNNVVARDRQVSTFNWKNDERDNGHKGIFKSLEFQIFFNIEQIGISIVNQHNEELVHIYFQNTIVDFAFNADEWNLNCSVLNIQIDNQLKDAEKSVILYAAPQQKGVLLPAISITAQKLNVTNVDADVFKHFHVSIVDMIFNLEEILLLKLMEFIRYDTSDKELNQINNAENGAANRAILSMLAKASRYYFTLFLIQISQLKLSVFTTSHLPDYLNKLKKKAGIKLLRFEDATIQLSPFKKVYSLMTKSFMLDSIYQHYKTELKSQAARILGSVDFLGNPLGFMSDVSDGINELITEGSFGGLIWNVAHGISDSTVKVTSILSDSLGIVTMDQRHQEIRKRIKSESNHHLSAGFKGLGVGLLGGFTSIITQTYTGAVKEGFSGLFIGLGKGLIGTITKPTVGMLDFATSAASAVRETSRKVSQHHNNSIQRVRPPRTFSIDGLLLKYQLDQSKGQELFYSSNIINGREESEKFIALEFLRSNFFVIISSEKLRFFSAYKYNDYNNYENYKLELSLDFSSVQKCLVKQNEKKYITLIQFENGNLNGNFDAINYKNHKFICDNELIAMRICDQINYAKHAHEESKYFVNYL